MHHCAPASHHPPCACVALQLNNRLSLGQHWVWKTQTVKWSGAKAGHRALDVCCGSGDLATLLAKMVGRKGQVGGEGERQTEGVLRTCACVLKGCRLHACMHTRWSAWTLRLTC